PRNEADRSLHTEKELLNLAQTCNRILRAVDVEVPICTIYGELPQPIEVRQAARAAAELQFEDGGIQRRTRGRGDTQNLRNPCEELLRAIRNPPWPCAQPINRRSLHIDDPIGCVLVLGREIELLLERKDRAFREPPAIAVDH